MLSRLLRMSLHRSGTRTFLLIYRALHSFLYKTHAHTHTRTRMNIIGGSTLVCASHWHVQATGRITVPIGITYHRGKNGSGAVAVG
jgi:hypothetical protein